MTEQAAGDRARAARPAAQEPPLEVSDGDLAAQRLPAEPSPDAEDEPVSPTVPAEADPADAFEQQQSMPAEPDEYR